jgi:hypothetical protein
MLRKEEIQVKKNGKDTKFYVISNPDWKGGSIFNQEPYDPTGLEILLREGYTPFSMPDLADMRIETPLNSKIWEGTLPGYNTGSICVCGDVCLTENRENQKVIYIHAPHIFLNPDKLIEGYNKAISENVPGRGCMLWPYEFDPLLKQDGRTDEQGNRLVWVVDAKVLRRWPIRNESTELGLYGIDKPTETHNRRYGGKIDGKDMIALNHPMTIPFFGGEERARHYLKRHKEKFGDTINIWDCRYWWYNDFWVNIPLVTFLQLRDDICNGGSPSGYFVCQDKEVATISQSPSK